MVESNYNEYTPDIESLISQGGFNPIEMKVIDPRESEGFLVSDERGNYISLRDIRGYQLYFVK